MSHWIKKNSSNIQYHYNIKNDNNKLTNNNFFHANYLYLFKFIYKDYYNYFYKYHLGNNILCYLQKKKSFPRFRTII